MSARTGIDRLKHETQEFERLSLNQRIQHWLLIFSFVLLVVTGLPLRYWETAPAEKAIQWMGGIEMRGDLHRFGALMLIGLFIYHLFYVLFAERGAREFRGLLFGKKDITDLVQMLKYYFGLAKEKPRFGRFSYLEKFEFFGVGWGSVIMIATGLALWYKELAMALLPKWALDLALVMHSWEALLAFLSIIILHMYNVHFNPSSFPMSKVWLTGRMTAHQMKEEHQLEYEQILSSRS
jgi:cytochrome b subunit of formate dehydrogenase